MHRQLLVPENLQIILFQQREYDFDVLTKNSLRNTENTLRIADITTTDQLTFPLSTNFANISITEEFCSHTMCQKSATVVARGACVAMNFFESL